MRSYRTEHDSWPWRGTEEQAREDARRGSRDRDLDDRFGTNQQRAYHEAFASETRSIERRREERREEERQEEAREERRRHERFVEEQRSEEEVEAAA